MAAFVVRRLLIAIPVLVGISIVTFVFANLAPGDPVSSLIRPGADIKPGQLEAMEALGLNQPWHVRYLTWLSQLLQGNLGATTQGTSVGPGDRIPAPNTIKLMAHGTTISLVLGVSLGVLSHFDAEANLTTF